MTSDPQTTILLFAFLAFFHLWGGGAIAAGLAGRRALPVLWGATIGGAPLYFGVERALAFGNWTGLAWQAICLVIGAVAVGRGLPRLRGVFLRDSTQSLMIGMLIMIAGATLGAFFFERGSEALSLILGGGGFLLGAMWFGAGIKQLRGR